MSENQIRHEALMDHIILPRFLPQSRSQDFHPQELELLMRMVHNVESLAPFIPENTLKMVRSLATVHRSRMADIVSKEISNLKPGETFAMFIRRQNCAIMIHHSQSTARAGTNDMIVATFPGRLHPNEVYKNASDLEVNESMVIFILFLLILQLF